MRVEVFFRRSVVLEFVFHTNKKKRKKIQETADLSADFPFSKLYLFANQVTGSLSCHRKYCV